MSLEKEFAKYKQLVAEGKHKIQDEPESDIQYYSLDDVVPLDLHLLVPVDIMNGIDYYAETTGLNPINILIDLMMNLCVGLSHAECIPKNEESAQECKEYYEKYDAVLLLTPYGELQEDEFN